MSCLLAALRSAWWWTGALMGDHDYARYVDHLARMHPDAEVPSEREYWRARHAAADENPGARCC
ncbi:MAG: YbdD/YjiX family protein [Rhodococcus sp. (in: high G+C Gram-positive bacteria)]|uniref:YbdD/YjiX family protein n=1 Tax=Rhodococcus sp. TaxID=1831 RepID=UPI003BAE7335